MKHWVFLLLLITTASADAEVTCSNEKNTISETTPNAEFSDNGDGTVSHIRTGLVWMRCSLGQSWDGNDCTGSALGYSWQGALQVAQDINSGASNADGDSEIGFASLADWRLPNRNELESIVEERCWEPAINVAVFPNTPNLPLARYWSSSPDATQSVYAWGVYFDGGYVGASVKSSAYYVRLVRAGQ